MMPPRSLPAAALLAALALPAAAQSGGSLMGCPATGLDVLAATGGAALGCACWQPAPGPVWGTDVYAGESAVCAAALHAGVIARPAGGAIRVEPAPAPARFAGSARHGIASETRGQSAWSFRIEPHRGGYGVAPGR